MFIEKRTYTLYPGKMRDFLAIYEAEGLPLHRRYLDMVGYFTSDIGALNQVISLWRYASLQAREDLREKLYADPEWIAFGPKTTPFIQHMDSAILKPTAFSPTR